MAERADPYYQHDALLGEAPIQGRDTGIHLRLHVADEPSTEPQELFPLRHQRGTRTYVHAKPYLLEPDVRLTVALAPRVPAPEAASRPGAEIGRVVGSEHRGWRRREIGQAQAWHYHEDRTLVLWESFLEERFRSGDDPAVDAAHVTVWQGFERWLLAHLCGVERIMTTWEDEYDRDVWAKFLRQQGYAPLPPAAFIKEVSHS